VYQILSKSDDFWQRYGDLTIFKMAAVRPLGFWKFAVFVKYLSSTYRSASSYNAEIGQSVDELWPKKRFSRWRPPPSWILKISIFGHVTVIGFNIWCSVKNFIKIRRFLTDIWRLNDFQNGGRPPFLTLKNCSFCHVALVVYQILSKSDDFSLRYGDLASSKWRPSAILDLLWRHNTASPDTFSLSKYCPEISCSSML